MTRATASRSASLGSLRDQPGNRRQQQLQTVTPAALTITRKPITVTAGCRTKVYGSAVRRSPTRCPPVRSNRRHPLSGNLTRAAGGAGAGSPYAITQGRPPRHDNYDLTVTPAGTPRSPAGRSRSRLMPRGRSSVRPIRRSPTRSLPSARLSPATVSPVRLARVPGEAVGTYEIRWEPSPAGLLHSDLRRSEPLDHLRVERVPAADQRHRAPDRLAPSKFGLGQTIPAKFVLKNAARQRSCSRSAIRRSRAPETRRVRRGDAA